MARTRAHASTKSMTAAMPSVGHRDARRIRIVLITLAVSVAGWLATAQTNAQALPQRINDTGQTHCFNNEAYLPSFCKHPEWPGQDAVYGRDHAAGEGTLVKVGAGSAGFDFTKISNSGAELPASATPGGGANEWACTRDNVTGLVWQVAQTENVSWRGARRAVIDSAGRCGFNDWRLPAVSELLEVVHYGSATPAIDAAYFPSTTTTYHWAADGLASDDGQAWVVNFGHGYVHPLDKLAGAAAVRAVRGGARYEGLVDNGDGTVTDPRTGLMWDRCSLGQNTTGCEGQAVASRWQQALMNVQARNGQSWRGYSDWRLPNVKELASLLVREGAWPAIDATAFPNTDPGVYWTSTNHVGEPRTAWGVFFGEGNVFGVSKASMARVRLVRTAQAGGDGGPPDALFADDFDAMDVPPAPPTGNLPVLTIQTVNAAPILDRENYVDATLTIAAADPALDYSGTLGIRGRGNSTWDMPKKPYRLRLDSASSLLGMPSNRHWVLLANHADKSLLRNHLALELGWRLDMAWTPRAVHVEVVLNGDPVGIYQLAEHIRIGSDRVDIPELGPGDTDPVNITGGYLLEVDERRDCDPAVQFDTTRSVPFCIDNPDEEGIVPAQFDYIRGYVQSTEDALYGPDFASPATGYAAWLGTASFIDFFLVNELMRNQDARGFSSIWNYKDRNGLLQRGPLWDFDIAAGNIDFGVNSDPRGWWLRTGPWYERLFLDPAFVQAVRTRWNAAKADLIETLIPFIDAESRHMGAVIESNFQRWDTLNHHTWPNAVITGSHAGETAYLKDWLRQRIAWLDDNL